MNWAQVFELLLVWFVALFIPQPIWMRLANELMCRTIGKAFVICPHCGVAGIVNSDVPYVFR